MSKHYKKEDLIQAQARQLKLSLNNLKELNYKDSYIFETISREYGMIIAILSEKHPEITLKELQPINQIYIDYRIEYLGE